MNPKKIRKNIKKVRESLLRGRVKQHQAEAKAETMREKGDIDKAKDLETRCEIYQELEKFANGILENIEEELRDQFWRE